MEEATKNILSEIGFDLNPKQIVNELSVAEEQIVEIAKALSYDVKLLILDEPTAPLMPYEVAQLLRLYRAVEATRRIHYLHFTST
jgi:ABC-type sugar transport system ATPase subunit